MAPLRSAIRGGWLPSQHGAWAMLLAPLAIGIWLGSPTPRHIALAACWIVGYGAFFACGQWLRSRRKPRFLRPMAVYGAISALAGIALLFSRPELIWWAIPFAPLLAVSLWCSHRRMDRSLVNDTATVLAACLMTPVATAAGAHPDWVRAVPAAIALFAYFEGTVFYVKTMIRERGNPVMLRISIGYHAACTVLAALASPLAAAFFALATARAVVAPRFALTPKTVGLIEMGFTIALAALAVTGVIMHPSGSYV